MSELTVLLIGSGMSLVTGFATWWITRTRSLLDQKRRLKRQLMIRLISNRHDLSGDPFTSALNDVAVVFADSADVRSAIREIHEVVVSRQGNDAANGRLISMFRAMLSDLDLPVGDFTDSFLLTPFDVRSAPGAPSGDGDEAARG